MPFLGSPCQTLMEKKSRMKRVYLAGKYSDNNVLDVLRNIGRGEYYAGKLFMAGFAPFCPWHDKDYVLRNFDQEFTVPMFYDYSMAWLEVSDCVVVLSGYETSKGTLAEIKRAEELGIPVHYDIDLFLSEFARGK